MSSKIKSLPDSQGHFGIYGGRYVPETLFAALEDLANAYRLLKKDKKFQDELTYYLNHYAGRPTPVYEVKNLSNYFGRARIFRHGEPDERFGKKRVDRLSAVRN